MSHRDLDECVAVASDYVEGGEYLDGRLKLPFHEIKG